MLLALSFFYWPLAHATASSESVPQSCPSEFAKLLGLNSPNFEVIEELGQGGHAKVTVVRSSDLPESGLLVRKSNLHGSIEGASLKRERKFYEANLGLEGIPRYLPELSRKGKALFFEYEKGAKDLWEYWKKDLEDAASAAAGQASVILQLSKILGRVHKAGFAHLDVKPQNLLILEDGQVRLNDFGSAVERGKKIPVLWENTDRYSPKGARPFATAKVEFDIYAMGKFLQDALGVWRSRKQLFAAMPPGYIEEIEEIARECLEGSSGEQGWSEQMLNSVQRTHQRYWGGF